jgi:hypothetical protein
MKKLFFTILAFSLLYGQSNAQSCYTSGPSICTPTGQLSEPGLVPIAAELAPVINGTSCTITIQFQNYDTLTFDGTNIHVNSLTVDSIGNLPGQACWATNKTNNQFTTNENGCIAVTFDNMNASPGQYQLQIFVTANTVELGTIGPLSANAAGLYYYVRVINQGGIIPGVDTTGQAAGSAPLIQLYGGAAIGGSGINCDTTVLDSATYDYYVDTLYKNPAGIKNVSSSVNRLSVWPNPFNDKATVLFTSTVEAPMTEKLTDILGRTIWTRPMQVVMGTNQSTIDRSTLPSGIYFYSIGNGQSFATQKVVITE